MKGLTETDMGYIRRYSRSAFCDHSSAEFVRNVEADEAIPLPLWVRSLWKCERCGAWEMRKKRHEATDV